MATQSEPPTHAPVTLRGSVENLSNLPQRYTYPTGREGRVRKVKRSSERNASKLAMAGKADVPGISYGRPRIQLCK